MTVICFRRQAHGRRSTQGSDFLASRYARKGDHRQGSLGLRFSNDLLSKLGWQAGDYITCDFERTGDTGTFTVTRVPGERHGGIMLSKSNKGPSAVAKFCHEDAVLDIVFAGDAQRFDGTLLEHAGSRAVFAIDYTRPNS